METDSCRDSVRQTLINWLILFAEIAQTRQSKQYDGNRKTAKADDDDDDDDGGDDE